MPVLFTREGSRRSASGRGPLLALALLLCSGCARASSRTPEVIHLPTVSPSLPPPPVTTVITSTPPRPSHTPTTLARPTSTRTPEPTGTPPQTHTSTPTRWPTVNPGNFPLPPAGVTPEDHFLLARPSPPGEVASPSSSYRFGSTLENRLATHHGIDIGSSPGSPVLAVAPGVIFFAGSDADLSFGPRPDFYGNLVVLQLDQTWAGHEAYVLYGHLDQIISQTGQRVVEGEAIGTVGSSGIAFGPHLHLEIRLDSPDSYWAVYNPELWLRPVPGHGALAVRVTDAAGRYLPGVRLNLVCEDGAPRFADTYWDPGVNPDPTWGENAAQTDILPGSCRATAEVGGHRLEGSVAVRAGQTSLLILSP